jgi:hypothetical protein
MIRHEKALVKSKPTNGKSGLFYGGVTEINGKGKLIITHQFLMKNTGNSTRRYMEMIQNNHGDTENTEKHGEMLRGTPCPPCLRGE